MEHVLQFKRSGKPMLVGVNVEQDEDGVYVATCVALPGVVAQGKSEEEAIVAVRDAIIGYLFSLQQHEESIPGAGT